MPLNLTMELGMSGGGGGPSGPQAPTGDPPMGFIWLQGADGRYLKGADGAFLYGVAP